MWAVLLCAQHALTATCQAACGDLQRRGRLACRLVRRTGRPVGTSHTDSELLARLQAAFASRSRLSKPVRNVNRLDEQADLALVVTVDDDDRRIRDLAGSHDDWCTSTMCPSLTNVVVLTIMLGPLDPRGRSQSRNGRDHRVRTLRVHYSVTRSLTRNLRCHMPCFGLLHTHALESCLGGLDGCHRLELLRAVRHAVTAVLRPGNGFQLDRVYAAVPQSPSAVAPPQ